MNKLRSVAASIVNFFRPRHLSGAMSAYVVLLLVPLVPLIASAQESTAPTTSSSSTSAPTSSASGTTSSEPPTQTASTDTNPAMAADPGGPIGSGTAPSATLDAAEGSGIGSVGRAGIEPSTGVAHASIPFMLPKARGGAQPQLGLEYSSTNGRGAAGYGWSLGGVPSIQRHNMSGGPRYKDPGPTEILNPATADRFEYAGRPIVPICWVVGRAVCAGAEGSAALQPGEQFPDWALGWTYFRQQVDNFTRFFWSPDRRTWKVQGKGWEMEFGAPRDDLANDSALDLDEIANPSSPPAYRWNLVRQRDSNGDANVIVYDWKKFPKPEGWATDNLAYLTDVYSSPRVGGSNPARDSFAQHTRLSYRPNKGYDSGNPFSGQVVWRRPMRWMLDRVDVMSADLLGDGNRRLVREYYLVYDRGSDFAHWFLGEVRMHGACDAMQEQADGEIPKEIPADCSPNEWLPAARLSYWRDPIPSQPPIGNLYFGQDLEKPFTFLDIDGDSLADALTYKPDGSPIVARRLLSPAGAPPSESTRISAALDTSFEKLIFRNAMMGGWAHTGAMNALSTKFDNDQNCGDPQFYRAFTARSGPWTWITLDPSNQRLTNWMDGWDCSHPDSLTYRPETFIVDLDGDGWLDRFSMAYTNEDRRANTRATYFTRVDNDTRQVLPFIDYQRQRNPDGSEITDIYEKMHPGMLERSSFFYDMTGDQIPDLVRHFVREQSNLASAGIDAGPNDIWHHWVGLGDGTLVDVGESLRFHPIQDYVHDVNGDSYPDLLHPTTERITGEPGGTFDKQGVDITFGDDRGFGGSKIHIDFTESIPNSGPVSLQFADLNGSGVDSIIIIGGGLHSMSLTGTYFPPEGVANQKPRPGLLKSISNPTGATTTFEYKTAESILYNTDNRLPQPLHVVSRVTTSSTADVKSTGGPYVTDYDYVGPVYKADERRFLGFRAVEANQSKPARIFTTTYFQLADCSDAVPRWCAAPQSQRADNPIEALNGLPVLIHNRQATPAVPSVTHHRYRLKQLYAGLDGRTVRTAYAERTDTWFDDNAGYQSGSSSVAADDIVSSDLLEPVPQRRFTINQGPSGEHVHLAREAEQDGFGNVLSRTDYGMVEAGPENPKDEPITQRFENWQLPPGDTSLWNWRPSDTRVADRHSHFEYDAAGHVTRSYADLHGTLPLVRFHEDSSKEVAPTPNDASQDAPNVLLSQIDYDQFGNTTRVRSAGARCSETTYDDAFHQLPSNLTVYTNGCSGTALRTRTYFERGLEVPTTKISPDGMVSSTEYDPYGRPTKVFTSDPTQPGRLEREPSAKMTYWDPWRHPNPPAAIVKVETRDDDGTAPHYHSTWAYIDPYGQPIASVRDADPGAGDAAPFIVSGEVERDSIGRIVKSYEPRFAAFDPNALRPPVPVSSAPASAVTYFTDNDVGRAVLSYGRDGRFVSEMFPRALVAKTLDAADLATGTASHPTTTVRDGHGRTVLTQRSTSQTGASDTVSTRLTYLPTGEVATVRRSHIAGNDVYARSMTYDSFGRVVENLEPNTSTGMGTAGAKGWRYAYNNAGDIVGTSDARGCGKNARWDGAGRLLEEVYSPCLNSHPDFDDVPATKMVYDAPEVGQEVGAGGFVGRVAAAYDRAQRTRYSYDGRGRSTLIAKQLAVPEDDGIIIIIGGDLSDEDRSSLQAGYAPHWYKTRFGYDAANRVTAQTAGADVEELLGAPMTKAGLQARDIITTSYTARGTANRVGGSYGDLLTQKIVDADGLVTSLTYGDRAGTTASYDYNARRVLKRAFVHRNAPDIWTSPPEGYTKPSPKETAQTVLQDLRFDSYDDMNNPLLVGDARIADEWPAGAQPITRHMTYDDEYKLRRVDYASGDDVQVSPFKAEAENDDLRPIPEQKLEKRVKWQAFDFDWQGNLVKSDDDAHAFHDRSMGTMAHGTPSAGPNRVVSASAEKGHAHVSYDDAGNLTKLIMSKPGPDPEEDPLDIEFSYEWDEVGRLTRAMRDPIAGVDFDFGVDFQYTYSSSGARVTKSVQEPRTRRRVYSAEVFPTLRLNDARFHFFDFERTKETETIYLVSNRTALARVAWGSDELPTISENQLHVYLTMTDPLGSTAIVVDKSTSELVERSTYLAFGQAEADYRPDRWTAFREDYRYTGKEDDIGVGLTYFGARYYVAALGQWASADPLTVHGHGSDMNPYAFVFGSPQKLIDPTGLAVCNFPCFDNSQSGGGLMGWQPFGNATSYGSPTSITPLNILATDPPGLVGFRIREYAIQYATGANEQCPSGDLCADAAGIGVRYFEVLEAIYENVTVAGGAGPFGWNDSGRRAHYEESRDKWERREQRKATHRQMAMSVNLGGGLPIGGVVSGGAAAGVTFANQLPGSLASETEAAAGAGVSLVGAGGAGFDAAVNSGTVKFVVTEAGELVVAPHTVGGVEISHAVLSGGRPVLTAGQAEIAGSSGNYFGMSITNHSGHFMPSEVSLSIARDLFGKAGVTFP